MLSIGKLSAGQIGYYEGQVAKGRDDYYSGRGEAPGEWTGRGAGLLGLEGLVVAEQFHALLAGVDPSDPELERPLRATRGAAKVVGFDLTFSAPKSVSVLFAAADEQTSGQLIEAHEAAVRAALEFVEDEAVRVRRGKGGLRIEAGAGVVAAAYRHRMSRALDPQLHTHVVCANVARGEDGRWTALDGRALYQEAQTAGYLYQAHLRAEVRERLGLEWGPVAKGAAELRDIDAGVRREFSRRRQEMLEAAREAGVTDLASARGEHLATLTRDRKTYGVETHTWREEIRARAGEHGLTRAAIDRLLGLGRVRLEAERAAERDGREPVDERRVGDHLAGAGGLTELANAFGARDALREFAAAAVQGLRVSDTRKLARRFLDRGDVVATVTGGHTTEDLVACERRVIAAAIGRAATDTAVVDEHTIARVVACADRALSDEQAEAVRGVARSGNGIDVIEALAGTGKTYTAGVLRQVYEAAGRDVIGLAPTGRAVRELAEEAGVASWTIDRALVDAARSGAGLPDGAVVLLDEAGMAGTRKTEQVLAMAERAGAKVIAIGDSGQLASVQAGGWMRAVGERVGAHRLTQVMRQRDVDERRALARLHAGDPDAYLAWSTTGGRVAVHTTTSATDAAVTDWIAAAAEHGIASAVLIARDNDLRAQLNDRAREHQRARGTLGDDETYGPVTVAVGDRVICRQNDRRADVDNGTRGTVRAVHRNGIVIDTDGGTVRELPALYVAEHVEHAYCLTGHGMQGGTVEHATVVAAPRHLTRGWSYTALSRARGTTRLHIDGTADRVAERDEIAPAEAGDTVTADQVLARACARMSVRDDEDLALDQLPDLLPVSGHVDDPELVAARQDPTPVRELAGLRAELDQLTAQRAGLPLEQLQHVEHARTEVARAVAQLTRLSDRLAQLPATERTRLGRTRNDHAAERARLAESVQAAAQLVDATREQQARTERAAGPLKDIRAERDAIDRRISAVQHAQTELIERVVTDEIQQPSPWTTATVGPRPTARDQRRAWQRATGAATRYRLHNDLPPETPGLGPEPSERDAQRAWRTAHRAIDAVQDRGHTPDRDRA